ELRLRAAPIGRAADGAERRPADGVAAPFIAHLPSVAACAVHLACSVTRNGDAPRSRAQHDPRALAQRTFQCDLDIGGYLDGPDDSFPPKRVPQFLGLGRAPGTGRADDHHVTLKE